LKKRKGSIAFALSGSQVKEGKRTFSSLHPLSPTEGKDKDESDPGDPTTSRFCPQKGKKWAHRVQE